MFVPLSFGSGRGALHTLCRADISVFDRGRAAALGERALARGHAHRGELRFSRTARFDRGTRTPEPVHLQSDGEI